MRQGLPGNGLSATLHPKGAAHRINIPETSDSFGMGKELKSLTSKIELLASVALCTHIIKVAVI